MNCSTLNPALVQSLLDEAHQTAILLAAAIDQNHRLIATLKSALEAPVEGPLNAPSTRANPAAEHRRNHRRGTLSRITSDPEIEAFIRARLDTDTLSGIVAQIAATFPQERHISLSCLSRWWIKHAKPCNAQPAATGNS